MTGTTVAGWVDLSVAGQTVVTIRSLSADHRHDVAVVATLSGGEVHEASVELGIPYCSA